MSEITIAIPYYRGRDYLRTAVESVLTQAAPAGSWALLIVDDGERGEARTVLRELHLDPDGTRVRCIENKHNLGMVGNWNRCLDEASSPLVSLLHADDVLEPNYVATQLRLADANAGATAFFSAARIIDAHGSASFSFADWIKRFFLPTQAEANNDYAVSGEEALHALMAGNFIMCPTLCFRLAKLGGRRFDDAWLQVQDLEFTARLLLDGDTLIGTRDVTYAYRRHDEGATAVQSETGLRFDEEFELFERVANRADTLGWPRAAATSRRKSIVRLHLLYRALESAGALRFDRASEQLRMAIAGQRRAVKTNHKR